MKKTLKVLGLTILLFSATVLAALYIGLWAIPIAFGVCGLLLFISSRVRQHRLDKQIAQNHKDLVDAVKKAIEAVDDYENRLNKE
jgi:hypothetical protein